MGVASRDESKTLVVGRPNVVDAKGFFVAERICSGDDARPSP